MSADLFAEFEHFSEPTQQAQQPPPNSSQISKSTTPSTPLPSSQLLFGPAAPLQSLTTSVQQSCQQNNQWFGYQQSSAGPGWATLSNTKVPQAPYPKEGDDDDDDGWGDFEVAPSVTQPAAPALPKLNAHKPSSTEPGSTHNPTLRRTRITRAPTIDLLSNNLIDIPGSSTSSENSKKPTWVVNSSSQVRDEAPKLSSTKPKGPNADVELLFDADDFGGEQQEEEDDEFGEFETVQNPPELMPETHTTQPTHIAESASQLLSELNLTEPSLPYPQAPRSPSFRDRNPFPGLALTTPHQEAKKKLEENSKATPVTAWPSVDDISAGSNAIDENWGSFEDFSDDKEQSVAEPSSSTRGLNSVKPAKLTPKKSSLTSKTTASTSLDSSWDWDPVDTKPEVEIKASNDHLPPTNVPPPSVLLSIFPQLFDEATQSLYQPVSGQAFSIKKRILSDPKTIEFLKGYLALAMVAARIIAGRRLRWHRDKFLSQSMSISAAGSKGMKLASIDKAQTAREDREATDVVAMWNEQIGRLRSAVAAANSSLKNSGDHLMVPDIRETMQVQTAKGVPTAVKACLICGLKRDERIPKVDYGVEDSFGEWWTDHWGHTACKRFWLKHEANLRTR
ncbi:hypothetical protein DL767_003211 [Monosporascus sp. MG133]|nr:hypothetical protein DL767_003211 [Monosporascus sp. MG133]